MKTKYILIIACIITLSTVNSLGQNITFQVDELKPLPNRTILLKCSISGSGLLPKGHLNVHNSLGVSIEYLTSNKGKYRILPTHMVIRHGLAKDKKILSHEEANGIDSALLGVYSARLDNKKDDGKVFTFEKKITIPLNAIQFRINATMTHQWSLTWPAIIYKHKTDGPYIVKDLKFPPKGPCKDDKMNNDDDNDGIPNWKDLCPNQKGDKGLMGCKDKNIKNKALADIAEKHYRREVRDFLKCAGFPNANMHAVNLNFNYDGEIQYKDKTISLPGVNRWQAYWLSIQEEKCKGKLDYIPINDLEIFTSIYHEVGHYVAEIIGMHNVSGASGEHNTWVPSNPGKAFDEGRADLIMLLMAKKRGLLNIETKRWKRIIMSDYGKKAADKKLPNQPGAGMSTEGAVTSVMYDILPDDPCKAFGELIDSHKELKLFGLTTPQSLRDWMIAYNLYTKRRAKTLSEMVEFDKKSIETLRNYKITPEGFGYIYNLKNKEGLRVYDIHKAPDNRKQLQFIKFIGLKNMVNKAHVGLINMAIETSKKATLNIEAHSEYTVEINDKGDIHIDVLEGYLKITRPDNVISTIREGNSFDWPLKEVEQLNGQDTHFSFTPCIKNNREFAISLYQYLFDTDTDGQWYDSMIEYNPEINRNTLIKQFMTSVEYTNLNKTDERFIKDLYMVTLGINVGQQELHFWLDKLKLGIQRFQLVDEFINSHKFDETQRNCKNVLEVN